MARLTKGKKGAHYLPKAAISCNENGFYGEAVEKLAKFEDICDRLHTEQSNISAELETLRKDGKTNSCKFKELMTKKLINSNMLSIFEIHELA